MPSQSSTRRHHTTVAPAPNGHPTLRLPAIENPKGLRLRFIYWVSRKRLGKVPTGMKVIFPRVPGMLKLVGALHKFGNGLRLDDDLRLLVHMQVSAVNGCGSCLDLGRMMAFKENKSMDKLDALPQYRTSPLFTDRERAAIAYAEEVTRAKAPSDETFETLRKHFADWEIAELTVIIALEHFMNLQNVPLGIGSDGLCLIAQARMR